MRIAGFCILLLVAAYSALGQNRDYSIEVSLEDVAIDRNAEAETVTVIITNNEREVLATKALGQLEFDFAKCSPGSTGSLFCKGFGSSYRAVADIPTAKIGENEKFEFKLNLVELAWQDAVFTCYGCGRLGSGIRTIKDEHIYFFAKTRLLTGYKKVEITNPDGSKKKVNNPEYSFKYSNVINVVIH